MIPQPTSIQLLDAAVAQERETLGRPEPAIALASLLARWLLVRSDDPHIDVVGLFGRAHGYVQKPDRSLTDTGRAAVNQTELKQIEINLP
jgi:hypothetical protein